MYLTDSEVINQQMILPGLFLLTLHAAEVAGAARPGQFLHLRCGKTLDPLLRRPISIHFTDREKGEVSLLYRIAGKGTSLLSQKKRADKVSLLGPLGNGFKMTDGNESISVVAGGIGLAPLYFLLCELSLTNRRAAVFLGSASIEQLILVKEIKALGHQVYPCTDDGSSGFHGPVTELFEKSVAKRGSDNQNALTIDLVYGCGPRGMLKRLCDLLRQKQIPGEVSLEEKIGCGVGACLSCACKIREGGSGYRYHRACVEGPVFKAGEVVWE